MKLVCLFAGLVTSAYLYGQKTYFKHLDGFSARQSFIINDTIYTIGNKITNFTTFYRYNVFISKTDNSGNTSNNFIIAIDSFENDTFRSTLIRYGKGSTLHNENLYSALTLAGNGKKDRAFLAKYSTLNGISDTLNCTKDTFATVIEEVFCNKNNQVVCGFYFYYLSQLTTKLTTFIYYYKDKKIKWSKLYPDESLNSRWRLKNTLNGKGEKYFFVHLQHQQDFAGVPRVTDDYVIKMDTLGNELWRCQPNNRDSINTEGMQMVQKPNGNLLVSWCDYWYRPYKNMIGSQQPQGNDNCTVWFAEIDANGKVLWRKSIKWFLTQKIARNNYENLFHSKVIAVKDGLIWSGNYSYYYRHNYLLKTDFNGNPIWYREYELYKTNTAEQEFIPYDVTATSDGGYVLTGEFISQPGNVFKNGCQLATIIKVDSFGCLLPGCQKVDSATTAIRDIRKIGCKVYPNPANETVNIELPKGKNGDYVLEVFDMQGKLIEKISIHTSLELNTSKYANGFYLFKLYNEKRNEIETHKITVYH
jgi:hypothetical protein